MKLLMIALALGARAESQPPLILTPTYQIQCIGWPLPKKVLIHAPTALAWYDKDGKLISRNNEFLNASRGVVPLIDNTKAKWTWLCFANGERPVLSRESH